MGQSRATRLLGLQREKGAIMTAWTNGDAGGGCTLLVAMLFLAAALPLTAVAWLKRRHT